MVYLNVFQEGRGDGSDFALRTDVAPIGGCQRRAPRGE